jgi:hypothetical protein
LAMSCPSSAKSTIAATIFPPALFVVSSRSGKVCAYGTVGLFNNGGQLTTTVIGVRDASVARAAKMR